MVYGIYLSAGGLQVNQYRMEVLANNLANADTPGFKHDLTVVSERRPAPRERLMGPDASDPTLSTMTGGSLVAPTQATFEQGAVEVTGNPLDVALTGAGFFTVETEAGVRYTRDGRFTLNDAGELVTVAGGHRVLDEGGSPISVPRAAAGRARIDANGQVRAGKATYGRLSVVDFEDKSLLHKTGGNLMAALGGSPGSVAAGLKVGAVEKSTVDPIRQMVSMIEVNRAYEFNATLIGLADSTLGRVVNDVGRVR